MQRNNDSKKRKSGFNPNRTCYLTADGKGYCEECGLKPYSQKNFVQQITAAFPDVTRDIDRMAKRRILMGIRLGEVLG